MGEPLFGDILRQCMQDQGWTTLDLAKTLGVDVSLVRRWLRNGRPPALSSPYVGKIVAAFSLPEAAAQRLQDAQVALLKDPPRATARRTNASGIRRLLDRAGSKASPPKSPVRKDAEIEPTISKPENVARAAIDLLGMVRPVVSDGTTPGSPVYLTFQGADLFEDLGEILRSEWQSALRHVLYEQQRNVIHLLRLERDARRSVALVESMLGLFEAGGVYEPRYFAQYGTIPAPYDLIVVPEIGALVLFATSQTRRCDAALFITDPEQTKVLVAHCARLAEGTLPLAQHYRRESQVAVGEQSLEQVIADTEARQPGDQFIVQDYLNALTRQEELYRRGSTWWKGIPSRGTPREARLAYRLQRIAAFHEQVRQFRFRDIIPRRAVDQLVDDGKYIRDPSLVTRLNPAERRDLLKNVVSLLRRYPLYELALVDQAEEAVISPSIRWEVKGGHTVFLRSYWSEHKGRLVEIGLVIHESTLASAFRDYFMELWERISPRNRDKEYIIWWLEQRIVEIEKRWPKECQPSATSPDSGLAA